MLVNAVNTLGALCQSDKEGDNQRQVVECGAVTPLVELLAVREEVLPSATAAAIAEVCRFNGEIQVSIFCMNYETAYISLSDFRILIFITGCFPGRWCLTTVGGYFTWKKLQSESASC